MCHWHEERQSALVQSHHAGTESPQAVHSSQTPNQDCRHEIFSASQRTVPAIPIQLNREEEESLRGAKAQVLSSQFTATTQFPGAPQPAQHVIQTPVNKNFKCIKTEKENIQ